jgi:choline dehydrogenase-like flavoprotein
MYNPGQKPDFDSWAMTGNNGRSWDDLLPYFKKHERIEDPAKYASKNNASLITTYDKAFHGHYGPIHTSFSAWRPTQNQPGLKLLLSLVNVWVVLKDGWVRRT